ncbi:hypothetical protein M231_01724 [Tremella mesenterica]|uniref:Uncharacterized protein n=1 Tax=Tremella mesenterica TaxID=5217 RepID=A0A4Q1BSE7_TREME|nr:hypothetical protein M231_01724 [Tremella mesenterica]
MSSEPDDSSTIQNPMSPEPDQGNHAQDPAGRSEKPNLPTFAYGLLREGWPGVLVIWTIDEFWETIADMSERRNMLSADYREVWEGGRAIGDFLGRVSFSLSEVPYPSSFDRVFFNDLTEELVEGLDPGSEAGRVDSLVDPISETPDPDDDTGSGLRDNDEYQADSGAPDDVNDSVPNSGVNKPSITSPIPKSETDKVWAAFGTALRDRAAPNLTTQATAATVSGSVIGGQLADFCDMDSKVKFDYTFDQAFFSELCTAFLWRADTAGG